MSESLTPEEIAENIARLEAIDGAILLTPRREGLAVLRQLQAREAEVVGLRKSYELLLKGMGSQAEIMDGLKQETRRQKDELGRLRVAVAEHHAQKADDRCWMDDIKLYEAFGLPRHDLTVGDKEAMLANCRRYVEQRCFGGGPWKSYAELEAELERLRSQVTALQEMGISDAYAEQAVELERLRYCVETVRGIDVIERGTIKSPIGDAYFREETRKVLDNCEWFQNSNDPEWMMLTQQAWDSSQSEIERLRAALAPFADINKNGINLDDPWHKMVLSQFCRKAAEVLAEGQGEA